MAQLSNDCFAQDRALLPVDEAARLIEANVTPVKENETVALREALGRVASADLIAPIALPSFENSAVDGFAVRHSDIGPAEETRFRIVERVFAGAEPARALAAGEAARIFTGAPMPRGADTVYMQEDSRIEGDVVVVPAGLKLGANRRTVGEDVRAGAVAIPAGRRLKPQDVALVAALGIDKIAVRRRVRVALFSTGNEIAEPGRALQPAALYDANRYLLIGLLARLGAEVDDLGIVADDTGILARAIDEASAAHDLIITTGGVSTGEADHVKEALERLGRIVFWRVGIKPGRPVAMGVVRGAAFTGLPGNPAAVFVTFAYVTRPLLLRLAGALPEPLVALPVRAAFAYKKKKARREYVRVALRQAADGALEAVKHPQEGAGVITSLTETDGFLELPEDLTEIAPGTIAGFLSYQSLIN